MSPTKEFRKTLTDELDAHGLSYRFEACTKHVKLVIAFPAGEHALVIPSTPSDWRGALNARSLLRRWIKTGVPARPWSHAKAA